MRCVAGVRRHKATETEDEVEKRIAVYVCERDAKKKGVRLYFCTLYTKAKHKTRSDVNAQNGSKKRTRRPPLKWKIN